MVWWVLASKRQQVETEIKKTGLVEWQTKRSGYWKMNESREEKDDDVVC